jgi:hypothetical protein
VAQQPVAVAVAGEYRGLDVLGAADLQHLRAHEAREAGRAVDPDGYGDIDRAVPERGDDRERHDQARDREHDVDRAHEDVVEPAADRARDETDERAAEKADQHRDDCRLDRQLRAVDGPGELVAPQVVGAEQVVPAGCEQHGVAVLFERVAAREQCRCDRGGEHQHQPRVRDEQARGMQDAGDLPARAGDSPGPLRPAGRRLGCDVEDDRVPGVEGAHRASIRMRLSMTG